MITNKNILPYFEPANNENIYKLENIKDMLNKCDDNEALKRSIEKIYKFIYGHKILALIHPNNMYIADSYIKYIYSNEYSYMVIKVYKKNWLWSCDEEDKEKFTDDELTSGIFKKSEMRIETILLRRNNFYNLMYKHIGKDADSLFKNEVLNKDIIWSYALSIAERKLRDSSGYKIIKSPWTRDNYLYDNGKLDEFCEKTKELNINILEDHVAYSLYKD